MKRQAFHRWAEECYLLESGIIGKPSPAGSHKFEVTIFEFWQRLFWHVLFEIGISKSFAKYELFLSPALTIWGLILSWYTYASAPIVSNWDSSFKTGFAALVFVGAIYCSRFYTEGFLNNMMNPSRKDLSAEAVTLTRTLLLILGLIGWLLIPFNLLLDIGSWVWEKTLGRTTTITTKE